MTFTGEEMSLDIPEGGLSLESGWNIKPLNFKVAMYRVMYNLYFAMFYLETIISPIVILWLITFCSISFLDTKYISVQKQSS